MTKFGFFSFIFASLAASIIALTPTASQARSATTIIELFTSQGCSSCLPADELLADYARRPDVLAISMPVDYWDYLGWKDTLANPANSQRQRDYASIRGDRMIYTPQVIINGVAAAPGNDQLVIDEKISATKAHLEAHNVTVDMESIGDNIIINVASAAEGGNHQSGTVWLLLFEERIEVPVTRGENAGQSITYTNVVREMTPVGTWNGDQMVLTLPKADIMSRGHEGCAVLLQSGPAGPIIGAAILDNW
ncbi:MAG: DUF1223 domain-containing protein [Rhizobiales bacterium]|nr:DUF1223 domain-containing protein [Hyphomicrobiales bacterium]